MNTRNYQKELERIIQAQEEAGECPRLLIHACCAPCSSYVTEYLSRYFRIVFYFYNPNLDTQAEYDLRCAELVRFVGSFPAAHEIFVTAAPYEPEAFRAIAKGHEQDPERGERCLRCYRLRLEKTAAYMRQENQTAIKNGSEPYRYFASTLTLSPLKSAAKLNEIGEELAASYGLSWLPSDFKKKNGYLRSIELSREYGLYRQNYCGCVFSKRALTFTR